MDRELLAALLKHAEQNDPSYAWHIEADNLTIRLKAATPKTFADPDEAWLAARALRDSITALGHEIHGICQVGVVSECEYRDATGSSVSMPITGWRGRVELWFATQPGDR